MDPYLTTQALARTVTEAAVRLAPNTAVSRIEVSGGAARGVVTREGTLPAETVVIAAGPWSPSVAATVGVHVPVRPRRIQIVATAPIPPLTRMVWSGNGLYSRQDARGRLHFGAEGPPWDPPAERFECDVTVPTVQRIARRMHDLMPSLGDVPITHAWAGIIGPTPDLIPVIEALDDPRGVVLATGFGGNGFGTAPAVGECVGQLIATGRSTIDLTPFSRSRGAGTMASA